MEKIEMNIKSLRIIVLLGVLLLGITPVLAMPVIPMTVYGHVFVDGTPASTGLTVYAKDGTDVVTQDTTDATGYYILSIEQTSGLADGAPIDLWVETYNVTRITLTYMDVLEVDLTIPAAPPENEPPIADADGPYTGTEGFLLALDGSGSTDSDGTIVSYDWDFGDLTTGTGMNPSHTYAQEGTYTVTLTVIDNDTAASIDSTTATISDIDPTANFYGTPMSGVLPLQVSFTDTSTSYDGIVSWSWTFGDGGISPDQNPSHIYDNEGTYTVTLTVSEDDGDEDTKTRTNYIDVTSEPTKPEPVGGDIESVDRGALIASAISAYWWIPAIAIVVTATLLWKRRRE